MRVAKELPPAGKMFHGTKDTFVSSTLQNVFYKLTKRFLVLRKKTSYGSCSKVLLGGVHETENCTATVHVSPQALFRFGNCALLVDFKFSCRVRNT